MCRFKSMLFILLFLFSSVEASYDKLARLAGISPYKMNKIVKQLVKVETSSGKYDVLNPRSGAYGKYQVMPKRAQWYAKKLSIPFITWKKPKNQDKLFKAILKDNIISLKKHRYGITAFSIYGAHQQGFYGFYNITKKRKISKSTERNIRANLPRKYQKINRRLLRLVWILYWKKRLI